MVGLGVLRECLLDPDVDAVLTIGRTPTDQQHPKLQQITHADLFDLSAIEDRLSGFDACFFCLGVTSVGKAEADYRHITYVLTLSVAKTLLRLNPELTFVYVSGAGTDGSGRNRAMWSRVKGQTEMDLMSLPFRAAYMFRPAMIVPLHGIRSRTLLYRIAYLLTGPFLPMLYRRYPKQVTTTEQIGRAMLVAAKSGAPKQVLESIDINELGATTP
jgi:uncharacterized protein YbjT (DUF2867 family)